MFGKTNQVAERIDHGLVNHCVFDNGFVYIGRAVTNGNWGDIVNAGTLSLGTTTWLGQLAEGTARRHGTGSRRPTFVFQWKRCYSI